MHPIMKHKIMATYKDGEFHLDEPCDFPDGTRVEIYSSSPFVFPPTENDPAKQREGIARFIKRTRENPLNLRPMSRDEMHDYR